MPPRSPGFLILGAPKCGTTALAQFLSSHPDVCLSTPKEPHFFDANYSMGFERYLEEHFSHCGDKTVMGEATPSYLMVPWVAERIRRHLPQARLIILLRNPVDRAWSSWWMLHSRGMERTAFEEAIRRNEMQSDSLDEPDGESNWKAHVEAIKAGSRLEFRTYLQGGYYAQHLERYYEHFPQDHIRVVFSHSLREHPDDTIRDLWRFIGVTDRDATPSTEAVNEALGGGAGPILRMAQAVGLMRFRHLLSERLRSRLKALLAGLGTPKSMDPLMREELVQHFKLHNDRLGKLLGENLSDWNR